MNHDHGERELRALLRGEGEAVRQARRWAHGVLASGRLGIPAGEREDLVQETMVAVYRTVSRPGFTIRTSLRALIRTIAAARGIDWLRRAHPHHELIEDPVSREPSPAQQLHVLDELSRVEAALAGMDEKHRQIIVLRLRDGLSFAEIAGITGVREGTLRVRLHDCLKRLRRRLAVGSDRHLGS